jgi:hypothetical protein
MHVHSVEGAKVGAVREVFVEMTSGQIDFLIVEAASLLGGTGKFHPIPWTAARYDAGAGTFHLAVSKDTFKGAPSYDRTQLASSSYGWEEQATRYFAAPPV